MSDELNPVAMIIKKYTDTDSLADAIEAAEQQMFDELRKWEKGAPSYVMLAANISATESMIRFIVHMAIDALSNVHDWEDKVAAEQELLAYATLRLIREDKMIDVIKLMRGGGQSDTA